MIMRGTAGQLPLPAPKVNGAEEGVRFTPLAFENIDLPRLHWPVAEGRLYGNHPESRPGAFFGPPLHPCFKIAVAPGVIVGMTARERGNAGIGLKLAAFPFEGKRGVGGQEVFAGRVIFVKPDALVPGVRLSGSTILASTKIEVVELIGEDQLISAELRGWRWRGGQGYVQGAIAGKGEANN